MDFDEHVTACTDDIKNFIPMVSILEDFLLRVHVKLFVEERMEQWNKHGFNVDGGWGQVFKVYKQHISIMNTKRPPPTTRLYDASVQGIFSLMSFL